MRIPSWPNRSARGRNKLISTVLLLATLAPVSDAITFNSIPSANLDLTNLGRVGLAGDFDGISLYEYEGQNENGFSTNGSQSILTRFPNGDFATLATADAGIQAMCSFIMSNGAMAGVVVGGNFTSLSGIESQGVAMFNPNTSAVVPLPGLSGQVSALLCDEATNTVYVGGSFKGANSTNAIAWVGTAGWTNLPFEGFNGPVTSISKASSGHIIFGGFFTALGNASGPATPNQQIINISGANITAVSSSTTTGFSDPSNIVCKTGGVDGSGNTWLLADNTGGSWKASFGFGFEPTMLRLWNTHQDGRGTKTWRYTAEPINGIMNFTYTDPDTGLNASCTSECPLSSNTSVTYQDFHFVNVIGMNAFQIDISAWYGSGGGLDGIELFENNIFSYAINTFNEPACASISTASNATVTGPWTVTPSHDSASEYLTASVTGTSTASVVFLPDIKQSGNYSVNMYTPGCLQDSTCSTRGRVNITGVMTTGSANDGFNIEIFQTNNYDKYDQIYFGYIEASSSSFRPSVTLSASSGQDTNNLTIVAQRVGFTLISSAGGLNGLFEYDPTQAVTSTDFTNSTFDEAGANLPTSAGVNALANSGSTTFVAGNFTTSNFSNIFEVSATTTTPLAGTGLNGQVMTMFLNGTNLFVGGEFSSTESGSSTGLVNVAVYDTSKNTWSALGAGVNGQVQHIVPLLMNITANTPETVITLTGDFTQTLAFGQNGSSSVSGFAVWVPSHGNWLQNLNIATMGLNGQLTASVDLPSGETLFAGSLSSSQLSANGAVSLSSGLSALPVHIQPSISKSSTTSLSKRATSNSQNVSGVVTGLFYNNGGRNVTVLGGHFTATGTNGSSVNNLVFINGSNSDVVTGVGSSLSNDSTILAMAVQGDTLFAGGSLTGTVNSASVAGLISFNLLTSTFGTQPPSLTGGNVNAVSVRPNTADVYVAGGFSSAGSLSCPSVCLFSTTASQWNRPGTNLGGTANTMTWASTNSLIVGGALTVNGGNISLATYDVKGQTWATAAGASAIPGPVSALTAANSDTSELWVAGTATNGSAFLMKFDGSVWNSVGDVFGTGTNIRGLQVLSLSKSHDSSALVSASQTLMITGALNLPGFGNASSALFNGTSFQPFALTTTAGNTGGSLSQIFSQNQNFFASPGKLLKSYLTCNYANSNAGGHLAKGFVVLISLGIALALVFLLVIAGVLAERIRRRREGYVPAPTSSYDRSTGMSRVPPEQLFSSLGQGRSGVEKRGMVL